MMKHFSSSTDKERREERTRHPQTVWETVEVTDSQKHLSPLQGGGPAPRPQPATVSYVGRYELQREWRPLQRQFTTDQDLPVQAGAAWGHGRGQVQSGSAFRQGTVR